MSKLTDSDIIWAVFTINHSEENVFDPQLKELLEQISRDIGFGLDRIDIVRQEKSANALKDALLRNTTAGVALISYPERVYIQVNRSFLDIMGYANESDLFGANVRNLYPDDKTYRKVGYLVEEILAKGYGEMKDVPYVRSDGNIIYADISGNKIMAENYETRIIWTMIDVTERRRLTEELERQALYDTLTGLPNRRFLEKETEKAVARSKRHNNILALAILDLDNFKPVNDTYGHEAGDKVLQIIGGRLRKSLRKNDFVARLGGDEFVLLIEDFAGKSNPEPLFAKIEENVREPIVLDGNVKVAVGISMGVCVYPYAGAEDFDTLIRYADKALYESKENKLNRVNYWKEYCEPRI